MSETLSLTHCPRCGSELTSPVHHPDYGQPTAASGEGKCPTHGRIDIEYYEFQD